MKTWEFRMESTPSMISEKLDSSLESFNGFVFNIKNDKKNLISFKIRKRLQYAWYIIYHNNIIVNGRLGGTETKNATKVEITFKQHFLWKLVIFTHLVLGSGFIIALIANNNTNIAIYSFAAALIAIGIFLWSKLQKKYNRNVQEYKNLISEILDL
ncbi:DUF423 domain-containing protein [Christiangramia sp. OXR-203]|jgi:hypothetical protein|uniref:DUF423 domain-containing protein n=1 Tax=Christiangramia sp. OXR-203 TaxID=3100176 RepID=UPI002AC8F209|nr:DUF423 domain-containing protein [Christiangramia sp. OXR-203]WPY97664.1 DUF423 domain-containing protein [Christiangramia sp. OXR-203]